MPDHGPWPAKFWSVRQASLFIIYKFWQNCASVRQVSDLILKTEMQQTKLQSKLHQAAIKSWRLHENNRTTCNTLTHCGLVMTQNTSDSKSTLVKVMAWCCQTRNHYLDQCWPRSMPSWGVTRPHWVHKRYLFLTCLEVSKWFTRNRGWNIGHLWKSRRGCKWTR